MTMTSPPFQSGAWRGGALPRGPGVAAFSHASGQWRALVPEGVAQQQKSAAPPPRSGHAAVALGETSLLVFGGAGVKHEKLADAWRLDLATKRAHRLVYSLDAGYRGDASDGFVEALLARVDAAERAEKQGGG